MDGVSLLAIIGSNGVFPGNSTLLLKEVAEGAAAALKMVDVLALALTLG